MLNGQLELVIPYILNISGNQFLVSSLLGVMNFGALVGTCIIAFRGEINNKVKCLIYGIISNNRSTGREDIGTRCK